MLYSIRAEDLITQFEGMLRNFQKGHWSFLLWSKLVLDCHFYRQGLLISDAPINGNQFISNILPILISAKLADSFADPNYLVFNDTLTLDRLGITIGYWCIVCTDYILLW